MLLRLAHWLFLPPGPKHHAGRDPGRSVFFSPPTSKNLLCQRPAHGTTTWTSPCLRHLPPAYAPPTEQPTSLPSALRPAAHVLAAISPPPRGQACLGAAAHSGPERLERTLRQTDVEDKGERAAALDRTHGPCHGGRERLPACAARAPQPRPRASPAAAQCLPPASPRAAGGARSVSGLSSSPQRAGSGTRPRWTTHSRPQTTDVMDVAHGYDGAPSGPTEIQPLEEGVEPNVHRALCFWGKNAMNKSPPHHESTGKRTDEQVSGTGEGGGAGHPEPRRDRTRT